MSEMNAEGRGRLDRMPEWTALARHRDKLGEVRLRELFDTDPGRAGRYSLRRARTSPWPSRDGSGPEIPARPGARFRGAGRPEVSGGSDGRAFTFV
ncbi:hypothetical protein [Streptomyces sp. NPDC048845]|uniref:hypothetical protein n=1 Tax=Streptomyces sp. NPDC048845 TaxID=3155390 RepID=UPI0034228063